MSFKIFPLFLHSSCSAFCIFLHSFIQVCGSLFIKHYCIWVKHLKFQFSKPNFSYFYLNRLLLQCRYAHSPTVNPVPLHLRQTAEVHRHWSARVAAELWYGCRSACGSSWGKVCFSSVRKMLKDLQQATCMAELHKYKV